MFIVTWVHEAKFFEFLAALYQDQESFDQLLEINPTREKPHEYRNSTKI